MIYDQYTNSQTGEGVPFNAVIGPLDDLDVEPGGLVYPSPGTKFVSGETVTLPDSTTIQVNGCPRINEPIAFPWLSQTDGTVNWKTPMTSAPTGSGLTINANGCDNGSGPYTTDSSPGDPSQGQSFPNAISAAESTQSTGTFGFNSFCRFTVSTPELAERRESLCQRPTSRAIFREPRCGVPISIFDRGTGNGRQEHDSYDWCSGGNAILVKLFLEYTSSWTTWVSCVGGDPGQQCPVLHIRARLYRSDDGGASWTFYFQILCWEPIRLVLPRPVCPTSQSPIWICRYDHAFRRRVSARWAYRSPAQQAIRRARRRPVVLLDPQRLGSGRFYVPGAGYRRRPNLGDDEDR